MASTFVVGLDGARWELIEPWIRQGDLPNIKRIREGGSWARSESCLPPVTFPNWKCYSSGKNPGKFGVFWFEHIDLNRKRITIPDRRSFKTAELWDYLNEEGYTTGVVNMPTMYPPREIDGFVICGGPDAVDGEYRSISSGYTEPKELQNEIEERYGYKVHPGPLLSSNDETDQEVDAIHELLDMRFDVAIDLFEEEDLDFVHVTLFYLNVLQHFFWNGEPTKEAWKIVDRRLGEIDDIEDTNLIIMSDHGCAPTTTEFYINEWLREEGYLIKKNNVDGYLQKMGLTRKKVLNLAKKTGTVDLLAKVVPERLQKMVPQEGGAKRERKLKSIELDKTKAVASGQGPIYINPDYDVEKVKDSLIKDLRSVTDEEGNVFDEVHEGDEVYEGEYVEEGPELIVDQRNGVHVNDGIGGGETQTKPDRWAAENVKRGIFIAKGPDFKRNSELKEISILDIAPTVLASFDTDIPRDMDGTVLPILESEDRMEQNTRQPIQIKDFSEEKGNNQVEERLKNLGYME